MSAEASVVVAVVSGDDRLVSLGLHQLRGGTDDSAAVTNPAHQALLNRFGRAQSVLDDRGFIASAEAALASADASFNTMRRAREGDSVPVRFTRSQLALTVDALQAFLDRPDPSVDAFAPAGRQRLVDPPEKVRPVLARYKHALGVCETADGLAEREAALLS